MLPHHRLKVAVCACPNGCTQPQIKDIGLVAHAYPARGHAECTACGLCVEACPDGAVRLTDDGPVIDAERCVNCGACARACPTDALVNERSGYAVTVGGRLGRHPRLAEELTVVDGPEEALAVVERLVTPLHGRRPPRGTLQRLRRAHRHGTAFNAEPRRNDEDRGEHNGTT